MVYGLQRYLSVEKEFIEAQYYVSFSQKSVYSEFFTREIILLGTEIEAAFKELCYRIDGSTPGNMSEYKNTILSYMPEIVNISVVDKQNGMVCIPFSGWSTGKLFWWDVYTGIKHNLVDVAANLGVAITMLQAYELMLFCVTAMKEDIRIGFSDIPKLFKVDIPVRGVAVMPNMDTEFVYDREEILKCLGYNK